MKSVYASSIELKTGVIEWVSDQVEDKMNTVAKVRRDIGGVIRDTKNSAILLAFEKRVNVEQGLDELKENAFGMVHAKVESLIYRFLVKQTK